MVAYPLPAFARVDTRKDINPRLEPGRKTVGDFERFVKRMIRGEDTVDGLFLSIDSIITMQLDHSLACGDRLRPVKLDLIVVLAVTRERKNKRGCDEDANQPNTCDRTDPGLHALFFTSVW